MNKNKYKDLFIGDIESALSHLLDIFKDSTEREEIIKLLGRFKETKKKFNEGLIDHYSYFPEVNKIREHAISFLSEESMLKELNDEKITTKNSMRETDLPSDEQPTFFKWLLDKKWIWIILSLFGLFFLIPQYLLGYSKISEHFIQIITCFVALILTRKSIKLLVENNPITSDEYQIIKELNLSENNDNKNGVNLESEWSVFKTRINGVIRQFNDSWGVLLIGFSFYYMIEIMIEASKNEIIDPVSFPKDTLLIFLDTLQYAVSASFIVMFSVFFFTTTTIQGKEIKNKFSLTYLWIGLGIVGFLIVFFRAFKIANINLQENLFWIRFLIGVFSGVAMCMFIGRVMDNKFIKVAPIILFSLCTYSIIRSFYPFFFSDFRASNINEMLTYLNDNKMLVNTQSDIEKKLLDSNLLKHEVVMAQNLKNILYATAYFLKTLLFFVVLWLFDTKRIIYFAVQEASLHFKGEEKFNYFVSKIPIESPQ